MQRWLPREINLSARHAFHYTKGLLSHVFHSEHPRDIVLTQLVSMPNRNYQAQMFPTVILGSVFDQIGQTTQYLWRNKIEIYSADT